MQTRTTKVAITEETKNEADPKTALLKKILEETKESFKSQKHYALLNKAVVENKPFEVSHLLQVDIALDDTQRTVLLELAIENGHSGCMRALLESISFIKDLRLDYLSNVLSLAIAQDPLIPALRPLDEPTLNLLLEQYIAYLAQYPLDESAQLDLARRTLVDVLMYSARLGYVRCLETFIRLDNNDPLLGNVRQLGFMITAQDLQGRNALQHAAAGGQIEAAKLLLRTSQLLYPSSLSAGPTLFPAQPEAKQKCATPTPVGLINCYLKVI